MDTFRSLKQQNATKIAVIIKKKIIILQQPAGHEKESLLESRCREQQLISAVVTVANAVAGPAAAAWISGFVGVEVISTTQQWEGLPSSNWPIRCN